MFKRSNVIEQKETFDGNGNKDTRAVKPERPDLTKNNSSVDVTNTPASLQTKSTMYKQFAPSQSYLDAMSYTNSLLEKLNTGRTQYSDKLDSIMEQISNKSPFSYDFNTDPMFQAQLNASMASGQKAMQNTMGQAAALTGGYGSSYAQAVGNQAYNEYVQGAYDNLPDYYGMALDAYNSDLQNMYNQAEMYASRDQSAYDRLSNAYSANYNQAQNQYANEYSNYWQTNQMNEEARQYNENLAYNNYWQTQKMNEDIRQFNANLAENQYEFDKNLSEEQRQYNQNLAENRRQYNDKMNAVNLDYDYARETALNAANKFGYGSDEFIDVVTDLANKGYDIDDLLTYANASSDNASYTYNSEQKGYVDQWSNSSDASPVFRVVDSDKNSDNYAVDQFGNYYTKSEMDAIKKEQKKKNKSSK